ncbi:hypothetical protein MVEN_00274800 [Mycena venus]|uniref:Uncharacterized protein n=1 Tax=Mycena venus TaxID=2733690 RepID=A0A8H6Z2T9_9AGAR|nr:hypothetical protein MVEN_00274800 [Mycena venus]
MHNSQPAGFFPEFMTLRNTLPTGAVGSETRRLLNKRLQHVLFDLATLWDRSLGGTTMVLRIDGTTMPNTPLEPQYLRASAYLPPSFVANHTTSHAAIVRIAQTFIESVGVPMVQDWHDNARLQGWPLTQAGFGAVSNTWSPELIPDSRPGTSHYKFFGRPVGALETLLGTLPAPASAPAPAPVPVVVIGDEDEEEEFDDVTINMVDAIEHVSYVEAESAERLEQIHQLEQQIDILITCVAAADMLTADLEGQLLTACRALSARSATPPTTPSHSQPRPPAIRNPVSSSCGPPPYSPIAPHRRSPFPTPSLNPRSPLAAPELDNENQPGGQLDDLEVFIGAQNLQALAVGIRVIICAVAPAKWHGELAAMGVDARLISPLIDIALALPLPL